MMYSRSFVVAALLIATVGCGFHTPTLLACQDSANARCSAIDRCSNGVTIARVYGTLANCVERYTLLCERALASPLSGASAIGYEKCAEAAAQISCADVYAEVTPAACDFVGGVPTGGACAFNSQCATRYCGNARSHACGTCAAAPADGDSCATSSCAPGQTCVASTQRCQTVGVLGDACDVDTAPCGADLSCISVAGAPAVCVAATAEAGGPCANGLNGCDGQRGFACEGITQLRACQLVAIVDDGEPCGALPDGTTASCGHGGTCFTSTGATLPGGNGVCKAAAADNAPCDAMLGPLCLYPARCSSTTTGNTLGTCTVPDGNQCD